MRTYLTTQHVGVRGIRQELTVACGRLVVRFSSDAKRISAHPAPGNCNGSPQFGGAPALLPAGQSGQAQRGALAATTREQASRPGMAMWLPRLAAART